MSRAILCSDFIRGYINDRIRTKSLLIDGAGDPAPVTLPKLKALIRIWRSRPTRHSTSAQALPRHHILPRNRRALNSPLRRQPIGILLESGTYSDEEAVRSVLAGLVRNGRGRRETGPDSADIRIHRRAQRSVRISLVPPFPLRLGSC